LHTVTRTFRNQTTTIDQDLCSWLFWNYRGVGRMDSRAFWHWGRQWCQINFCL